MSRLLPTLVLDVRFQSRSKLYAIGVAAAVFFGLIGRFMFDRGDAGRVLAVFYLLAVGGTTYIFGASLVLLEKSQGTLLALRTSPMTTHVYVTSKAITLTGFAIVESAVIYAVAFAGAPITIWPMALGVACLGAFYVFIGLGQVASHDSVFSFLMPGAMAVGAVLQWPVFYVLDLGPAWLWYLVPTQGPLLLMLAASEPLEHWQWLYAIGMSIGVLILALWWVHHRFAQHIGLATGRP